jgi:triphosphoribosyl-dephospho-CoA synthetase
MTYEREVWDAAALLVQRYGADAATIAEERAREALHDEDDVVTHGVWLSIAEAIRELMRTAEEPDAVH